MLAGIMHRIAGNLTPAGVGKAQRPSREGSGMTTTGSSSGGDSPQPRIITIKTDAKFLEKMKKEGHADEFTVYCDESENLGGDNSAPSPMRYMSLAVGF
jgi:hypothetical protein